VLKMGKWINTKLGDEFEIIMGQSPPSKYYNETKNGLPFFQGKKGFGEVYPSIKLWSSKVTKEADKGDVLLSIRAPIGPANIAPAKCGIGRGLSAIKPNHTVSTNFVLYLIKSKEHELKKRGSGVTFSAITKPNLFSLPVKIPTEKKECDLIVEEIDTQFTRLDATVKSLKTIKKKLDVYRNSVLNAAFLGHLTDSTIYKKENINNILDDIRYGTSKKCNLDQKKTPVLRIPNVVNGFIDCSELKYCQFSDDEFNNLKLKEGDILVIRSNGSKNLVGRSAIVSKEFKNYCYAGYLIRLRLKKEIVIPSFFNYFFQSGFIRLQIEKKAKSTSGVNNVNAKEIGAMTINVFTLEEQEKIIEEIESRFSVIDKLEQTIDKALIKAEQLRKSILKSAFEGKLVKYEGDN
jgi:type I restriction enzyme, S subunit